MVKATGAAPGPKPLAPSFRDKSVAANCTACRRPRSCAGHAARCAGRRATASVGPRRGQVGHRGQKLLAVESKSIAALRGWDCPVGEPPERRRPAGRLRSAVPLSRRQRNFRRCRAPRRIAARRRARARLGHPCRDRLPLRPLRYAPPTRPSDGQLARRRPTDDRRGSAAAVGLGCPSLSSPVGATPPAPCRLEASVVQLVPRRPTMTADVRDGSSGRTDGGVNGLPLWQSFGSRVGPRGPQKVLPQGRYGLARKLDRGPRPRPQTAIDDAVVRPVAWMARASRYGAALRPDQDPPRQKR